MSKSFEIQSQIRIAVTESTNDFSLDSCFSSDVNRQSNPSKALVSCQKRPKQGVHITYIHVTRVYVRM